MIKQNDELLNRNIRKSGCYLLSLLWIAQVENKKVLSSGEINMLYKLFLDKGWIDAACTIQQPDKILNYVLDDIKIYQVGIFQDGEYTFWGWVNDEKFDWSIIQHDTAGYYRTHFVVGDNTFGEMFDPLEGKGYKSTGTNRFVLYKIF